VNSTEDLKALLRTAYIRHSDDRLPLADVQAPRERLGARTVYALVSCLLVLGTGGAALWISATNGGGATHPGPAGRTPRPTSASVQPIGFALVSENGHKLTVAAAGDGCTRGARLRAAETSSTVTLTLQLVNERGQCAGNTSVSYPSTRLSVAIGARRLVDARTGDKIPFVSSHSLARVTWLPTGIGSPETLVEDGWVRSYSFSMEYASAPIEIGQYPGNLLASPLFRRNGDAVSNVLLGRIPAKLFVQTSNSQPIRERIEWVESGYTFQIVSDITTPGQHLEAEDVLEHIARSLTVPKAK
jgi:hypothetical protein